MEKVSPNFDTSAVEIWAAQEKARSMRSELKDYISLYYGPSAWESIGAIEAVKDAEEAVYKRQEKIDNNKLGRRYSHCYRRICIVWWYHIYNRQG